ncbi:MAG TPA: hypothetical protein VK524_29265 [Polyangiaceae bacterium]|nr:hypothetical protein [Polyangiaceae bacterium]
MSEPVALRIVRPYASEDEFLAGDLWTLDAKGALLVDQGPLDAGTLVRFDVVLTNGERLIRAEGKVVKYVEPSAARPGGLRVRFTRFGGSTKTFIDRAIALRRASGQPPRPAPAHSERAQAEPARPVPARSETPPAEPSAELKSGVTTSAERLVTPAPISARAVVGSDLNERKSVLRQRAIQNVEKPANREALLERLRARARR